MALPEQSYFYQLTCLPVSIKKVIFADTCIAVSLTDGSHFQLNAVIALLLAIITRALTVIGMAHLVAPHPTD